MRNAQANEDMLEKLRKCPECGSTHYKEMILTHENKN